MDFEHLSLQNDESTSSSSPLDQYALEKAMVVAESSSHASKQKKKHTSSSSSKPSVPPKKAAPKRSSPKGPVLCEWDGCGLSFPRPTELHKHINKDHDPPIPCAARDAIPGRPPCDKMYYTNKDMHRHLRTEHPVFAKAPANKIPKEGGNCPHCGKFINRDDNLKRHIDEMHGQKKRARRDS